MEKYRYFIGKAFRIFVIVMALVFYQNTVMLKTAVAEARQKETEANQAKEQLIQLTAELDKIKMELGADSGTGDMPKESDAGYVDGIYTGEGTGFGGMIEVEVTVDGGEITEIRILSAAGEDTAYIEMAKDVTAKVLETQSTDVDTISGATFSSEGILKAAEQALAEAVK